MCEGAWREDVNRHVMYNTSIRVGVRHGPGQGGLLRLCCSSQLGLAKGQDERVIEPFAYTPELEKGVQ